MKIKTKLIRCKDGLLIFEINGFTPTLEPETYYTVYIKEYKSKRSLEQNKFMWSLIHAIALETLNDEWDIYIRGLEHCNQKAEYILALDTAEKHLKQAYRVVKKLDETRDVNGKSLTIFKCMLGSSKFNKAEFNKLLDYFIKLASELNISIEME